MDQQPRHPGDEAAEPDRVQVGDRGGAADRRQVALVAVAERPGVAAAQPRAHELGRVAALLHRDRRHAGQDLTSPSGLRTRTMSPSASTSGWPGRRQVRLDRDPAGAVDLRARQLGQAARQGSTR